MIDATCSVNGCTGKIKARGLCGNHYDADRKVRMPLCSVHGCENKSFSKQMCRMHYARTYRHGDIDAGRKPRRNCSVSECLRYPVNTDGYCDYHQRRFESELNGHPLGRSCSICSVAGCTYHVAGNGYCAVHYRRWKRGVEVEFERTVGNVRECPQCNESFVVRVHGQRYCSPQCKERSWRGHCAGDKVRRMCPCGQSFEVVVNGGGSNNRKWCDACRPVEYAKARSRGRRKYKALKSGSEAFGTYDIAGLRRLLGNRCHICHRLIDFNKPARHPQSATVDHLIPISRGGWDGPGNVALAHFGCNSRKRNHWVDAPMLPLVFADAG